MSRSNFETLSVYRLSEDIADKIWVIVTKWRSFAKETVGRQMVRASDSVGANIAEGVGRGSFQDNRRFVRMARGSLYETGHWLRRAFRPSLLPARAIRHPRPLIDELTPKLNSYLKSIGRVPDGPRSADDQRPKRRPPNN